MPGPVATGNDGWSRGKGSHHGLVCFLPSWSSQVATKYVVSSLFTSRAACLTLTHDYSLVDERGRADGEKPGANQLQKDTNVAVAVADEATTTCRPMRLDLRRRSHAEPGVNRAAADRMHCMPQPSGSTPESRGRAVTGEPVTQSAVNNSHHGNMRGKCQS